MVSIDTKVGGVIDALGGRECRGYADETTTRPRLGIQLLSHSEGVVRRLRTFALLALAASVSPLPAFGQTSANGSIRGYVRDATGAVVPDTAIAATGPGSPTPVTVVSDKEGYYRLLELPPGEYELTADRDGFARFVRPGIVARAGLNLTIDIDLAVGTRAETTTVRAETPMLEASTAVQAVNIAGELQRQVPLTSRRDWADSLLLVPGIVATTQAGSNKVFYYLHGADFSSLVLQIDGADMASTLQNQNGYINLSDEAIQDTQVKTGAVDAATPIGVGAVVSVVTRSGTNRLQGSAGVVFQGEDWNGNNAPGGTSSGFEIVQPDASLGGPVLKDQAWFFGAYRYTNNSLEVSRTPTQLANLRALVPGFEPLTMDTEASYFFVKGTARLAAGHRLEGFWQRDHSPEIFVGPTWAGKFLRREFGGIGTSVRLASAWNNSLTTRVSVSFNNKGIEGRLAEDGFPSRNIHQSTFPSSGRLFGTGTLVVLDNLPSAPDQPADKLTLTADVSWYRESKVGSHEIQSGVYFQPRLRDRSTQHYANGGFALEEVVLRDPSNPASGLVPFHRQLFDQVNVPLRWADSHDYAVYVQDAWRPFPQLTVSAGVRADVIGRKDSAFNVETQHSTEIDPRFGVNYLLARDGRRAIRASWTRVADVLAQTTQSAGSNVSGFRDLYDADLDGTFETTFITPGVSAQSTDRVLDDARHQPHTNEWIVGYRQQFQGLVSVDASVVRREFRERTAVVEINGLYEGNVFTGYRNEAFNDIFKITNNVWNWPVYTFLELLATKQTARFQGIASYTHQWRHLAGTWQPNDPASFIQPDAFPNSKGIGSTTSTFETQNSLSSSPVGTQAQAIDDTVRLGVIARGPWDIVVATNYTFQSGLWSGPIVTRLAASDPRFGPATVTLSNGRTVSNPLATTIRFAYPTREQGQFRLPALHVLNLRFGRDFHFARYRLEPALEIFNVTNHDAFYLIEQGGSQTFSPLYGQGRQRQSPRAAQVSARLVF
jgi:Carboxypeptidase regulatory-like domain/TonB dependent receptor-like, beta-barrel